MARNEDAQDQRQPGRTASWAPPQALRPGQRGRRAVVCRGGRLQNAGVSIPSVAIGELDDDEKAKITACGLPHSFENFDTRFSEREGNLCPEDSSTTSLKCSS